MILIFTHFFMIEQNNKVRKAVVGMTTLDAIYAIYFLAPKISDQYLTNAERKSLSNILALQGEYGDSLDSIPNKVKSKILEFPLNIITLQTLIMIITDSQIDQQLKQELSFRENNLDFLEKLKRVIDS